MSAPRVRRPEPCSHEDCGSRRFHVGDDGFTYCDQGHRQSERGTIIADDPGEFVITGRKQRRVDSDGESTSTSRSGFSGPRAYEQFLLCLQLVLREQLKWLISARGLPAELENVVRDLWALRIQKLQRRIRSGMGTDDESTSQVFSSQSEGEASTESEGATSATSRSSRRRRSGSSNRDAAEISVAMADTLALCYIGTLLLRIPISVADLCRWVQDGELIYYQSSKAVPPVMCERLPGRYRGLLDPQTLLKTEDLHQIVAKAANLFRGDYGMALPAINHTLLLFRWMRTMALPIEIFAATHSLTKMLELDYSFTFEPKGKDQEVLKLPEVRLMAAVITTTKLLFPLDDIERYPQSSNDKSALAMDWQEWARTVSPAEQRVGDPEQPSLTFQDAFSATEADCLAMDEADLDQYLDWYQQNLASDNVREHGAALRDADFRRAMMNMFPVQLVGPAKQRSPDDTPTTTDNAVQLRIRHVQSKLEPKQPVPDASGSGLLNDVYRTGSFYRRFRSVDELQAGDAAARKLYELAAEQAGTSLELMVRAVMVVERRVQKREEEQRNTRRTQGPSKAR